VLKASPASKKQRPHRQNEFSEHQNASNADALTGAGGFCKKLQGMGIPCELKSGAAEVRSWTFLRNSVRLQGWLNSNKGT